MALSAVISDAQDGVRRRVAGAFAAAAGRGFLAGAVVVGALVLGAAGPATAAAAGEPVDAGVVTLLQIADARLLEREILRFGAVLGRDPRPMRQWLARVLFRSRDLDGIDLSRPAMVAWRAGPSPLLAIIPVKDRIKFLDLFGAAVDGESPMVRTGDRDGLMVLSQSSAQGLREYRLLVVNETAYLARTAAECRQLAERSALLLPSPDREVPVLRLSASGPWLAAHDPAPAPTIASLGLHTSWPGPDLWARLWSGSLAQAENCELTIASIGEDLRFSLSIRPQPGSDLAKWTNVQRNSGSRLEAMVDPRDVALRLTSATAWGGALAAWGREGGSGEAWSRAFLGADKGGEWAVTVAVPAPGQQINSVYLEHPRSTEQFQAVEAAAGEAVGGTRAEATLPGAAVAARTLADGSSVVVLGTARHVIMLEGQGIEPAALTQRAGEVVPRMAQVGAPSSDSALASFWCDIDRVVRVAKGVDPDAPAAPAVISASLKVSANLLRLQASGRPESVARAMALIPAEKEPTPTTGR